MIDTGINTAPRGGDRLHRRPVHHRRAVQPAHPAHRRAAAAARAAHRRRWCATSANCNARLWNDKLGQISLATTTLFWGVSGNLRVIVFAWAARRRSGYTTTQASALVGVVAIGTAAGAVVASMRMRLDQATERDPATASRMGVLVDRPQRHHQRLGRRAVPDRARRDRRLPGRADERAAAAPRPQPDGRRPLDRGAELQRAGLHPRPRRVLHRHDALRPVGLRLDRDLRRAGRRRRCG